MTTLDRLLSGPAARGRHAAPRTATGRKKLLGALPVVLAGSLALTLGASPADAAPTKRPIKNRITPPSLEGQDGTAVRGDLDAAAAVDSAVDTDIELAGGATGPAQTFAPREYTVTEGDTVSDIAGRFGLSTASVLTLNGLSWKSLIFPGQVLSLNTAATAVIPKDAPLVRYTIVEGD